MHGFLGDQAYTFALGNVDAEVIKLMSVTKEALAMAVDNARENNRVGDISFAVENHTSRNHSYGVVRELVGHGVGKKLHEDPQVPNYGRRGDGKRLKEGMVLAIEPMINLGTHKVFTLEDGWTVKTADGKPSVHYEHTTAVRKNRGEALSNFAPIEAAEVANQELNSSHHASAEVTA